ncbi:MAG: PLP-dependent transferase [Chloroflexi bacterium]|nr:PLP-dependent transferase [Chloroflexota bacterium]
MDRTLSPETLAAQAEYSAESRVRGLVPPIHPSTAYESDPDGVYPANRVYTRADNPTYETAERLLAALEGGAACALFASGNAAATAVFQSLLPGDHVLVARVLYWGIRKWLAEFAVTWGLEVEFVDTTDPIQVRQTLRPGHTRLLWLETPANPTWEVTDLRAVIEIAHAANVHVAVDNTVPTPVLTRPFEFGADLVVHSATKYLNGHSDVLAGAVVTAQADPLWERIRSWRRNAGAVPGPFEAWLLQRGMRTLFVRVRRSSESALAVAQHFERHPALQTVLYPGLPSHPGYEIAARQMAGGFGGMLSIRVKGGEAQARAVLAAVNVFKRTTSLGGVESLIEHRRTSEGPSSPVPDDLLRLSIGLEAPDDLIADLEVALEGLPQVHPPDTSAPAYTSTSTVPPTHDLAVAVKAVLERSLGPLAIARGGELRLVGVHDGVVTLEACGSPGALRPLMAQIEALVRRDVPEILGIRFVEPDVVPLSASEPAGGQGALELVEQVRRAIDEDVNPAVAHHRGRVELVDVVDRMVHVRLEGGCQGCSLAAVTVWQGIEPVLRERVPEILGVVDVTDHQAGRDPFYAPSKR